jgi:hypothetical protein
MKYDFHTSRIIDDDEQQSECHRNVKYAFFGNN